MKNKGAKMRAIIIDAEKREVREGTASTLEEMQAIVGGYICIGGKIKSDDVYVNDEGLLTNEPKNFFVLNNQQPLAGNGFVLGPADDDGDVTACTLSVAQVKASIRFLSEYELWLALNKGGPK